MFGSLFGRKQDVAQLRQKGDVEGLVRLLHSKKVDEVNAAGKALAEMGGDRGARELLKLCTDADVGKRMLGAMHFMTIQDQRAIPFLIQMLGARELPAAVKGTAVMPLGQMRNPVAVTPLIDLYGHSTPSDEQLKTSILMALGTIGGQQAREFLVQTCTDPRPAIRSHAVTALGRTGDSRALVLLQEAWAEWEAKAERSEFSQVFAEGFEIIRGLVGIGGERVDAFLRAERDAASNGQVKSLLDDAIDHREKIVL